MTPADSRLQSALAALERNREMVRQRFLSEDTAQHGNGAAGFPRSATFRWLIAASGNPLLRSAALQALLGRYPIGRWLADGLLKRRWRRSRH